MEDLNEIAGPKQVKKMTERFFRIMPKMLTVSEVNEILCDEEFADWLENYLLRRYIVRREVLNLAIPLRRLPKLTGNVAADRIMEACEDYRFEINNRASEEIRFSRLTAFISEQCGIDSFELIPTGRAIPGWLSTYLISPVDLCLQQGLDPSVPEEYTQAILSLLGRWLPKDHDQVYGVASYIIDNMVELESLALNRWINLPSRQDKGAPLKIRKVYVSPVRFRVGRKLYCFSPGYIPNLMENLEIDGNKLVSADLVAAICLLASEPEIVNTAKENLTMSLSIAGTKFNSRDKIDIERHGRYERLLIRLNNHFEHRTPKLLRRKSELLNDLLCHQYTFEARPETGCLTCAIG